MTGDTNYWSEYIVHIPLPTAFDNPKEKAELMADVRYFLLVGSLMRPRKLASMSEQIFGLKALGTYFNIVDHHHICDREYCIEVIDMGNGERMAIISHGIGSSGAEIVIKETRALVHWCNAYLGRKTEGALIRGVGRSGTRGTIGNVPYATVGLSTASYNDALDVSLPDADLTQRVAKACEALDIPYAMGSGVSTETFWWGQGRHTPAEGFIPDHIEEQRAREAQDRLWRFIERGILFAEMEDYTVHKVCTQLGIPSVSAGAVIARRFDTEKQQFVIDYDPKAKEKAELWPAKAIIRAFCDLAAGK